MSRRHFTEAARSCLICRCRLRRAGISGDISASFAGGGEDGKFVISPQFDCAYPFDENVNGNAAVSNESGYGFINNKGEFTVEPQFKLASYYSDNGLSVVTAGDGYMLYVDAKGRTAYDNKHFTYAHPFESGAPYTFAYTVMTQDANDDKGETVSDITDEYYLLSTDGKTVTGLSDRMGIDCVFGEYYVGFTKNVNEGATTLPKEAMLFSRRTVSRRANGMTGYL